MYRGLNILIGPNPVIRRLRVTVIIVIAGLSFYRHPSSLQAQQSSVRTVEIYGSAPTILPSMGGSGVSYLSGVHGLRVNPANIQFNSEKKWTLQSGLLSMVHPNLSTNTTGKSDIANWLMIYEPYEPVSLPAPNSLRQNQSELNRLITSKTEPSHFRSSITQELLSLGYQNEQISVGLYAEYVFKQSFQVSRGWYDDEYYLSPAGPKRTQWLAQDEISYLAVGINYSERLDIFSDFTPVSDQFSLGFSPRVIMAGSHSMSRSESTYYQESNELFQALMIESAGLYSDYLNSLHTSGIPSTLSQPKMNHLYPASIKDFKEGLGFAMDVGLRYTRNLANELSLVSKSSPKVARALHIAFSINDIGYIEYNEGVNLVFEGSSTVDEPTQLDQAVEKNLPMYEGSPEQYFYFLETNGQLEQLKNTPLSRMKNTVLLPTKAQVGVHLLWNRWSVQADLQYALFTTFFSVPGWTYSAGASIQPIKGIIVSSGYTNSTIWGDDISIGLRLAGSMLEVELSGRWPLVTDNGNIMPSSVGFGGFNIRL